MLNVEVATTAVELPWSNGVTERGNAMIGIMVDKILNEENCSIELVLAWAISAKNYIQNNYEFSPNQLVFAKNPNLPNVPENKPPALENVTTSESVANNLNVIHAARKAFVEIQTSEKLKRAFLRKVRPSTSLDFQLGDKVYFKRRDSNRWRDPGKIIGIEKQQIFVKHGGTYVRINPCHIRYVKDKYPDNIDHKAINEVNKELVNKPEQNIEPNEEDDENLTINKETVNPGQKLTDDEAKQIVEEESQQIELDKSNLEVQEVGDIVNSMAHLSVASDHSIEKSPTRLSGIVPKTGSRIVYQLPGELAFREAIVPGRGGTAIRKIKHWYNFQKDDTLGSLNMEEVTEWKNSEDAPEEALMISYDNCIEVKQAKAVELDNWKHHNLYEEV